MTGEITQCGTRATNMQVIRSTSEFHSSPLKMSSFEVGITLIIKIRDRKITVCYC